MRNKVYIVLNKATKKGLMLTEMLIFLITCAVT